MTSLPTLRRKIFRSFSIVILLYGILGIILVLSILTTSKVTPKMLHVNYDSISAAIQMRQAWNALENPETYSNETRDHWIQQFETGLTQTERNAYEPDEKKISASLRTRWGLSKIASIPPIKQEFMEVDQLIAKLIELNEQAMFRLAQENASSGKYVLIGSLIYFLVSLVLSFLLADGLANRLSTPIKNIVEALHRRPEVGRRLKLISPNSLELLILTTELSRLWGRLTDSEEVDIRAVTDTNKKLEGVLEAVEDALLVLDMNGRVVYANPCMQTLIGLPSTQMMGQKWQDLSTNDENYMRLRGVMTPEMDQAQRVMLTLNGQLHQYEVRFRKVLSKGSREFSDLFLLHDISEKAERQTFREEFVELLSHEIKAPLQSLKVSTEEMLARKNDLPESFRILTETIVEDVERIRAAASEFIQVSQSQSKAMKLRLEHVVMNDLLLEWIKPFKILAKDRNVKLNFESQGSKVIWADLDPNKFPWAVSNLLSNAIRVSPEGGEVTILLTDRNGAVEVMVKDEGPGILSEDAKRIFDPFVQTAGVGKKGLFAIGLTIAKEVVFAHDGRFEYYPRQPRGSEFRIVLPFPP